MTEEDLEEIEREKVRCVDKELDLFENRLLSIQFCMKKFPKEEHWKKYHDDVLIPESYDLLIKTATVVGKFEEFMESKNVK